MAGISRSRMRIAVDLSEIFNDFRSRALICLTEQENLKILDVQRHIKQIFSINHDVALFLLQDNHQYYLPEAEKQKILTNGDTIRVVRVKRTHKDGGRRRIRCDPRSEEDNRRPSADSNISLLTASVSSENTPASSKRIKFDDASGDKQNLEKSSQPLSINNDNTGGEDHGESLSCDQNSKRWLSSSGQRETASHTEMDCGLNKIKHNGLVKRGELSKEPVNDTICLEDSGENIDKESRTESACMPNHSVADSLTEQESSLKAASCAEVDADSKVADSVEDSPMADISKFTDESGDVKYRRKRTRYKSKKNKNKQTCQQQRNYKRNEAFESRKSVKFYEPRVSYNASSKRQHIRFDGEEEEELECVNENSAQLETSGEQNNQSVDTDITPGLFEVSNQHSETSGKKRGSSSSESSSSDESYVQTKSSSDQRAKKLESKTDSGISQSGPNSSVPEAKAPTQPSQEDIMKKFSGLLALQSHSTPIVFQRKKKSSAARTNDQSNRSTVMISSVADSSEMGSSINDKSPTRDSSLLNIDYTQYPLVSGHPKVNDIVAFRMLRLSDSTSPEMTDYIEAKVLKFCETSMEVTLHIIRGIEWTQKRRKGKFDLEDVDSEPPGPRNILEVNWNEIYDTKLLYP